MRILYRYGWFQSMLPAWGATKPVGTLRESIWLLKMSIEGFVSVYKLLYLEVILSEEIHIIGITHYRNEEYRQKLQV